MVVAAAVAAVFEVDEAEAWAVAVEGDAVVVVVA